MPPYPKACYFRICPLKLQRPPTPFLPGHHPTGGHPYEPRSRRYYLATPRLRRINEPASSEVDISRARDNPEASQLNGPHISEIVLGTRDCGANVNRDGMLEIKSGELSRRLHKTALILSRASSSLTEYDIRRILEIQNDAHEHAADGGLEEVFPLRQPQTLRRSDSWVLMFSAPAHAEKYQRTILRLRQLHSKMSPTPNATAISAASSLPPQGGQGEVKSHTHPLTMPFQRVSTEAKLFPFDYKLQRAIKVQRDLIRSDGVGKRLFPVRLCVANAGHLNLEYIQRFLKHDGVVRGRPWAVSDSDDAIMRVNADSTASPPSVSVVDNWRINFLVASDAAQFVRVWHRRPLPTLDDLTDGRNPIIKAECVF